MQEIKLNFKLKLFIFTGITQLQFIILVTQSEIK